MYHYLTNVKLIERLYVKVPFSSSPKLIHCQPTLLVIYQSPCKKEVHISTVEFHKDVLGYKCWANYLEI